MMRFSAPSDGWRRIEGAPDPIRIMPFADDVVRIRLGDRPGDVDPVYVVRPGARPDATVTPDAITCGGARIRLDTTGLQFVDGRGSELLRLVTDAWRSGERMRVRFRFAGEQHFYGLGHGGSGLDRLGTTRRLWNSHVNHVEGAADIAVPLLLSSRGYGLFFDHPEAALVHLGDGDIEAEFDGPDGGLDFYYVGADGLRAAVKASVGLLGHPAMPPRWALGYMQSSRHFDDSADVLRLPKTLREKRLPCDAVIFLSTYGDAKGWNRGVGHLAFEPTLFADPAGMMAEMRRQNFHPILHEYPVVHPQSPQYAEARARDFLLDDGYEAVAAPAGATANYFEGQRYLDFAQSEAAAWWWEEHRALVAMGADGWWLDGGEGPLPETESRTGKRGLHNQFDLMRQEAFADGEARDNPGRRPFLLCRSGGPGMQRFGAACWSGDINRTFATLEAQIGLGLNAGLSGMAYWGTDVGGFYPSAEADPELYVRWFQFGAFTPIFRAHGRNWREHVPWAYGTEVEEICRTYLDLRYRLMPYTYTLAHAVHRDGLPIMRPLVMNYPHDAACRQCGSQYLWGDDILVAPVTRAAARHWPVYLPAGTWYDFWSGDEYRGPRGVEVAAPLDRLPLFVRAGAIVPMGPAVQNMAGYRPQRLDLVVYPDGASDFSLYEDDGETNAYRSGGASSTRFECTASAGELRLLIERPRDTGYQVPADRSYGVKVRMHAEPRSVHLRSREATGWTFDGRFLAVDVDSHPAEVLVKW